MKKFGIYRFFDDAGAVSTSKSITFTGLNYVMEVSKDGYNCRPRESKRYNSTYIPFLILAIFEIVLYVRTGKLIYDNWYMTPFFLIFFILSLIIYRHTFKDSISLRMNHGAEHKVLNAFMNHDLENVDKYSRFSDRCGGNIFPMAAILISISPIIKFPISIFLIYLVVYERVKPVRRIIFGTMGKFIQKYTTAEPTKEILENTKNGFKKLIYIEVEKMVKDAIKQERDIDKTMRRIIEDNI